MWNAQQDPNLRTRLAQDWDVGTPQKVSIWHDSKGSDKHWFLHSVTVEPLAEGVKSRSLGSYTFECSDWLSPTEGLKRVRAELSAIKESARLRTSQRPHTRHVLGV